MRQEKTNITRKEYFNLIGWPLVRVSDERQDGASGQNISYTRSRYIYYSSPNKVISHERKLSMINLCTWKDKKMFLERVFVIANTSWMASNR